MVFKANANLKRVYFLLIASIIYCLAKLKISVFLFYLELLIIRILSAKWSINYRTSLKLMTQAMHYLDLLGSFFKATIFLSHQTNSH